LISSGSAKITPSFLNSLRELVFEQIVGMPYLIASNTGNPNPSYQEGNTNILEFLYNKCFSSSFINSNSIISTLKEEELIVFFISLYP